MSGPLKDQVEERLPWLLNDLGFRISSSSYDYKAMGSSRVFLETDALRLQFVYDGSGPWIEVASPADPDFWMELGSLWYSLSGKRPNPQLEGWAWFFRDHLREISEALGPQYPATKQAWEKMIAERQEILARYVPPRGRSQDLMGLPGTPTGAFLRGPLGWIIAGALIVREIIR